MKICAYSTGGISLNAMMEDGKKSIGDALLDAAAIELRGE